MVTPLQAFVVAGTLHLDPAETRDYAVMTEAIVSVVEREPPLFQNDPFKFRTAATLLAVAWREGSLRSHVEGDCDGSKPGEPCRGKPHSFCSMQINDTSGGSEELNDEPEKCIKVGLDMLRQSMRACALHPIAWYAAGPQGCTNERAQRISRDRMALAKRICATGIQDPGVTFAIENGRIIAALALKEHLMATTPPPPVIRWPSGALLPEGYAWEGHVREENMVKMQDIVRLSDGKRIVAILDPSLSILTDTPDLETDAFGLIP